MTDKPPLTFADTIANPVIAAGWKGWFYSAPISMYLLTGRRRAGMRWAFCGWAIRALHRHHIPERPIVYGRELGPVWFDEESTL